MSAIVAIKKCSNYDIDEVLKHIEWLYTQANGPDPKGKTILVKPNITSDEEPSKAITTHPVVVEAVIKYLLENGALSIIVGDSPTIDNRKFTGLKSGIRQVAEKCGAKWTRFNGPSVARKIGNGTVKVTSLIEEVDLIINLPKLKTHELMHYTGAMKNIFGLVPGFNKAIQHSRFPNKLKMADFFVDFEEVIKPHFHILDGIIAMEGPGPGSGYPKNVNVIMASQNPLALDLLACRIIGYNPELIPINKLALRRGHLIKSINDIQIKGPDSDTLKVKDFRKITSTGISGIILNFLKQKLPMLRSFDKRPVFLPNL